MSEIYAALAGVRHIALATVNADGTPHNTPLFFAVDEDFTKILFASRESSLHSINFLRNGDGYAVMYDSNVFYGGLYLTLQNGRVSVGQELEKNLKIYNKKCLDSENDALSRDFHLIEDGYKIFVGDITKIEMYHGQEDSEGHLVNETRKEISAEDLLND